MKVRLILYSALGLTVLGIVAMIYWPDMQEIRELEKNEKAIAEMAEEFEQRHEKILKQNKFLEEKRLAETVVLTNDDLINQIKKFPYEQIWGQTLHASESADKILAKIVNPDDMEKVLKISTTSTSQTSLEFYKVKNQENLYYILARPSGDELFFEVTESSIKIEKHPGSLEEWIDFFTALKIKKMFKSKSYNEDISNRKKFKNHQVLIQNLHFTIIGEPIFKDMTLVKKFSSYNLYRDGSGQSYWGTNQGAKLPISPNQQDLYLKIIEPLGCLPFPRRADKISQVSCRSLPGKDFPFIQVCEGSGPELIQIQSEISHPYECYKETALDGIDSCETDQDCALVVRGTHSLFTNIKSKQLAEQYLTHVASHRNYNFRFRRLKSLKCSQSRCSGFFGPEESQP